jgi:hypothetical protein
VDEAGKIRYGWGNVAETFGEDPRWTDYIAEVRRGTSLTWKQYTAALYQNALDLQRPQQEAAERVYIKAQPMYIRFPRGEKTLLVSFASTTVGELIAVDPPVGHFCGLIRIRWRRVTCQASALEASWRNPRTAPADPFDH